MNDQGFDYNNYTPPQHPEQSPYNTYNAPLQQSGIDFKAAFGSGLFLALCIVVSVMFAITMFISGIDIICLLIMIGMWLCYAAGRDEIGRFNPRGLKLIKGSLLAQVILQWVAVGMTLIAGVASLLVGVLVPKSSYNGLNEAMADGLAPGGELHSALAQLEDVEEIAEIFGNNWQASLRELDWEAFFPIMLVGIGVFCFAACIFTAISTLLIYHEMHAFAKSVYGCAQSKCDAPRYARWLCTALIVMAVFNGISILSAGSNLMVGLQCALYCAIFIITHIFIKKYFLTPNVTSQTYKEYENE